MEKLSNLEKELMKIEWKPVIIDGIYTIYSVSSEGYVRNNNSGFILRGSPDKRGYLTVSIHMGDKLHTKLVHRLVATAFIPNPENKPTVNHLDGNKKNNKVSNLEWATHKENIDHAISTGLRNINGTNAVSNIYTEEQVHQVCKMLCDGKSSKYISEKLGVNINLPRRILYSGKWKCITSNYDLPEVNKFHPDIKKRAFELMDKGIFGYDELIKLLNLDDDQKYRKYLSSLRIKYNKHKKPIDY